MRERILYYCLKYKGDYRLIAKALANKEEVQPVLCSMNYVTIFDQDYPACFRRLRYPPWILFYQGHIEWLQDPCVGIIGARKCSRQALNNTKVVVERLKSRYVIVSGLALGIDAKAHEASLDFRTVGIIGCGLDRIYPKANAFLYRTMAENHCIISEYPPSTPPLARHFPWRNRLLAAASQKMIVIEATYKSGTMLTVNECIDLDVPIYCLPTAFENKAYPGCNQLISNGAFILSNQNELDWL